MVSGKLESKLRRELTVNLHIKLTLAWGIIGILLLAIPVSVMGFGGDQPTLEETAQSIDRGLICPVCPGETIDQSQTELASQMRGLVREKLAQGQTKEEIFQFFADSYGYAVLASPPKSGFNMIVWVLPIAVIIGGFAILYLVIRAMHIQNNKASMHTPDETLEPYLIMLDKELDSQEPPDKSGKGR